MLPCGTNITLFPLQQWWIKKHKRSTVSFLVSENDLPEGESGGVDEPDSMLECT